MAKTKKAEGRDMLAIKGEPSEIESIKRRILELGYANYSVFLRDAIDAKLNQITAPEELSKQAIRQTFHRLDALDYHVELCTELLSFFVDTYFLYTPEIPDPLRATASSRADDRKRAFIRQFKAHLDSKSPRLKASLLSEFVTQEPPRD